MNMILKKQMANRGKRGGVVIGRRKGFTLVEVIVVLVILAILAAIAIPALTGYIDKSEVAQYKAMGRTQLTAMQTFVNLAIGEGGLKDLTTGSTKIFNLAWNYPSSPAGKGFRIEDFTPYGKAEYKALTGDTESFAPPASGSVWPFIHVTPDGDIKAYLYIKQNYFGTNEHLSIIWLKDVNSTDPVTQQFLTDRAASYPGMTSGFNIYNKNGKLK
jgi:prepilin-type N-terminal cleavage/methylation domain-containing protein